MYGTSPRSEALCCDATRVSPAPECDGVALAAGRPREKTRYRESEEGPWRKERKSILAQGAQGSRSGLLKS